MSTTPTPTPRIALGLLGAPEVPKMVDLAQVAEDRRLFVVSGLRVGQLDDVTHTPCPRSTVVLQSRVLRVHAANRVGDTTLHRLRDLAAVELCPVGHDLRRLIGARNG